MKHVAVSEVQLAVMIAGGLGGVRVSPKEEPAAWTPLAIRTNRSVHNPITNFYTPQQRYGGFSVGFLPSMVLRLHQCGCEAAGCLLAATLNDVARLGTFASPLLPLTTTRCTRYRIALSAPTFGVRTATAQEGSLCYDGPERRPVIRRCGHLSST